MITKAHNEVCKAFQQWFDTGQRYRFTSHKHCGKREELLAAQLMYAMSLMGMTDGDKSAWDTVVDEIVTWMKAHHIAEGEAAGKSEIQVKLDRSRKDVRRLRERLEIATREGQQLQDDNHRLSLELCDAQTRQNELQEAVRGKASELVSATKLVHSLQTQLDRAKRKEVCRKPAVPARATKPSTVQLAVPRHEFDVTWD